MIVSCTPQRQLFVVFVVLAHFIFICRLQAQPSTTPREDFWITDGIVQAIAETNGIVYLGGGFNYLGPHTGGGVSLDLNSGNVATAFPKVRGTVNAVLSDENGGWFIGGAFDQVGDLGVSNLAHIRSNGSLDNGWNPRLEGDEAATVNAMAKAGNIVFVGGAFTRIGGQPRNNLAALDAVTAQPAVWNPGASDAVNALALAGTTLYAGGSFTNISGQPRGRVAALDTGTGQARDWQPSMNSNVWALAVSGTNVYVGGSFNRVNGRSLSGIAALDAATGEPRWNSPIGFFGAGSGVYAVALAENTVFVGGRFFLAAGNQGLDGFGAIDATTGRVISTFRPTPPGGFNFGRREIRALAIAGQTIFAGGNFSVLGGQARNFIAALNTTNGAAIAWNPNANGTVRALRISGNSVYAGGDFTSIGGQSRTNLAALNAATGRATDWNPGASSNVLAIAIADNKVYVGGAFSRVGGAPRSRVAALDLASGEPTSWNPGAGGVVEAVAVSGTNVYLGGRFETIGNEARGLLAAVAADTGQATDWNPNVSGNDAAEVRAISVAGNIVYVGGGFSTVGGIIRNSIAALDIATAQPLSWNPNIPGTVASLAVVGDTIYAGGSFFKTGVQPRDNIVALNATSGKPTLWNPTADGNVNSLIISGGSIYAAGNFLTIGGQARGGIAALDLSTGQVTSWNPELGSGEEPSAFALAVTPRAVLAGGNFLNANGANRPSLAVFEFPSTGGQVEIVANSAQYLADGRFQFRVAGTGGQRLIIQSSADLAHWSDLKTQAVTGSSFEVNITDDTATTASRRLYRAVLQP